MAIAAIIQNLADTLKADAALDAFLKAGYNGRGLTVVDAARDQTRIPVETFPCALLVAGDAVPSEHPRSELRKTNIHVLLGLRQENLKLAHDDLIHFYELAVDASQKDITRGGLAVNTAFTAMQTDFGVKAPNHFRLVTLQVTEDIQR